MPLPSPSEIGFASNAQPPQYILDAMGGSYDQSQYYWDPMRMALVDRYTGGSYGYSDIPDPSLGTDVVTNLSNYNRDGRTAEGTFHFDPGVNPYIAFPGETYNAGLTPNSGLFLSSDPNEIAAYGDSRRDRNWNGIGQVGALVGGMALGGALSGGGAATTPSYTGATTAAGLPTGAAAAAGGGVGTLAGSVPAVGASPGLAAGTAGAIAGGAGSAASGAGNAAGGAVSGLNWADIVPSIVSGLTGIAGANAQADSSKEALALAERMYNQTRADNLPRIETGNRAVGVLDAVQGLTTGTPDMSRFTASPDYQFNLAEGTKAGERALSAMGLSRSGPQVKEAQRYASGLASREYGSFVDRLLATAGLGTTGAAQSATAGANYASMGGQALQNKGAARSSAYGAVNDAYQGYGMNQLLRKYLGQP